jgi:hypothetical protein
MHACQVEKWNTVCPSHFATPKEIERKNFAGFPATIALAGTSFVTTAPAPTIAF